MLHSHETTAKGQSFTESRMNSGGAADVSAGMASRAAAAVVAAVSAATLVLTEPGTAAGGGGHLSPVEDRYEPGDVATLVGYTGHPYLQVDREPLYRASLVRVDGGTTVDVGTLELTDTNRPGWGSVRVSLTFTVPPDTPPGEYLVNICADPCKAQTSVGDLIGGFLFVGMDPPSVRSRDWPLDEPEIANLADDALLSGPGYDVTAAAVRAGFVPPTVVGPAGARQPQPPSFSEAPAATRPPTSPVTFADPAPAAAAEEPTPQPPWLFISAVGLAAAGAAVVALRRPRAPRPPERDDPPETGTDLVLTYEPVDVRS